MGTLNTLNMFTLFQEALFLSLNHIITEVNICLAAVALQATFHSGAGKFLLKHSQSCLWIVIKIRFETYLIRFSFSYHMIVGWGFPSEAHRKYTL